MSQSRVRVFSRWPLGLALGGASLLPGFASAEGDACAPIRGLTSVTHDDCFSGHVESAPVQLSECYETLRGQFTTAQTAGEQASEENAAHFLGVPLPGRILMVFNAAGVFELKEDGALLHLSS